MIRGSVLRDAQRGTWTYRHRLPGGGSTTRRGFRLKREAADALARSIWEHWQQGPPPPAYSVAQWVLREIHRKAPGLSPVTLANYKRFHAGYLEASAFGATSLGNLDQAAVARWVAELMARHSNATSVRSVYGALTGQLKGLIRSGQLPHDTFDVVLPARPVTPLRVWTPAQTRAALAGLAGTWHYTPTLVAVTTGLRVGELLALTWDDLQDDAVQVHRSLAWIDGAPVVKQPKSLRGRRRVELYPETVAALEAHRATQRERRAMFPEWDTEGLIFPAQNTGGHWRSGGLSTTWQRRMAHLDVPRLRWHDLRHTHASHLLAAGTDPATVADRLGHALQMTLKVYGHMIPGRQALAVQRGSAYLDLGQPRGQVIELFTAPGGHRGPRGQES